MGDLKMPNRDFYRCCHLFESFLMEKTKFPFSMTHSVRFASVFLADELVDEGVWLAGVAACPSQGSSWVHVSNVECFHHTLWLAL